MLPLEQIAEYAARGQWSRAGLPTPLLTPLQWMTAARKIIFEYGIDPLAPYDVIARAERIRVSFSAGLGTCGASLGRLLIVQNAKTPGGRWCGFHHERMHVHSVRFLPEGNESDLWGATFELAYPSFLPRNMLRAMNDAPEWFHELRMG